MLSETVDTRRSMRGDEHPNTWASVNIVSWLQTKPAEAEPLLREAVTRSRRALTAKHTGTLACVKKSDLTVEQPGEKRNQASISYFTLQCRAKQPGINQNARSFDLKKKIATAKCYEERREPRGGQAGAGRNQEPFRLRTKIVQQQPNGAELPNLACLAERTKCS